MTVSDADLTEYEYFTNYGHVINIRHSDSNECRDFGMVSFDRVVRFI